MNFVPAGGVTLSEELVSFLFRGVVLRRRRRGAQWWLDWVLEEGIMSEKPCTIRTRKFLTNRLLQRKQFVSLGPLALAIFKRSSIVCHLGPNHVSCGLYAVYLQIPHPSLSQCFDDNTFCGDLTESLNLIFLGDAGQYTYCTNLKFPRCTGVKFSDERQIYAFHILFVPERDSARHKVQLNIEAVVSVFQAVPTFWHV